MTRSPLALAARCACASVLTVLSATTVAAAQIPGGGTAAPGAGVGGTTLSRPGVAPELPRYAVTAFEVPAGYLASLGNAIDADGTIAGVSYVTAPALAVSGTTIAPDGRVSVLDSPTEGDVWLLGVGADGTLVGSSDVPSFWNGTFPNPYVWDGSGAHPLALPNNHGGRASGINSGGAVAGTLLLDDQAAVGSTACVWPDAGAAPVALPSGEPGTPGETAEAINDRGQVCGSSPDALGFARAARWDDVGAAPVLLDTHPDSDFSAARDLNAAGDVVGYLALDAPGPGWNYAAFLHDAGGLALLAPPAGWVASRAAGVNRHRQVVGALLAPGSFTAQRGFLWQAGTMRDLNELLVPADAAAYLVTDAADVNDRGQIVGRAQRLSDGALLVVRLDPVPAGR